MKPYSALFSFLLVLITATLVLMSCKKDPEDSTEEPTGNNSNPLADISNTYGFGVLDRIKGIWNGPVTSTTPLGGYPEWIVDFRPISENQISAKNELDTLNDIHMSFFVAKYNGEYRVCFRNGGSFGGQTRTSYFLADSVSETPSQDYYRFTEIINGMNRAYTEVVFRNDSVVIKSFTNYYNTQQTATPHMTWTAKLQDETSCQEAVNAFNFPKKTLTKDFSSTFSGLTEAIFYSIGGGDPYPEDQQPYLGQTTVNYSHNAGYTPDANRNVLLMITTEPLFNGFVFDPSKLKFRSRYVILAADDLSYTFNYMHPGDYYAYALYDEDGNGVYSSGDWMSTSNTTFTLPALGNTSANVNINFNIP